MNTPAKVTVRKRQSLTRALGRTILSQASASRSTLTRESITATGSTDSVTVKEL